jgi:hypothetical protein
MTKISIQMKRKKEELFIKGIEEWKNFNNYLLNKFRKLIKNTWIKLGMIRKKYNQS